MNQEILTLTHKLVMNTLLIGYCRIVWLGIILNLGFAIPTLLKDPLPNKGEEDHRSSGLSSQEGHGRPVELGPIGYGSAGPNCTSFPNGSSKGRNLASNRLSVIPNAPAHKLASDAFHDYPANSHFNSDTVQAQINQVIDRAPSQHMAYKHLIIPFAKTSPMR